MDIIDEIETKLEVIISELLFPILLPKKPEMNDPNKGRKIIKYSILSF
tara:strand:- start:9 stop:152 length:144 start_codon:yes stop_codon:yes gene_type:complete